MPATVEKIADRVLRNPPPAPRTSVQRARMCEFKMQQVGRRSPDDAHRTWIWRTFRLRREAL